MLTAEADQSVASAMPGASTVIDNISSADSIEIEVGESVDNSEISEAVEEEKKEAKPKKAKK
jgi:hypothetical protein